LLLKHNDAIASKASHVKGRSAVVFLVGGLVLDFKELPLSTFP
jgi:hypothetical protein